MENNNKRFQKRDGDWMCPNPSCGNLNFGRRRNCNRCGSGKSTNDEEKLRERRNDSRRDDKVRSGPSGLFKPGDWTCTICGNVNWERRTDCNICKNSRVKLAAGEKRDGKAGGFNERQERVSSTKKEIGDDGYDDFGVIKKTGLSYQTDKERAALERLKQSYSSVIPNSSPKSTGETTSSNINADKEDYHYQAKPAYPSEDNRKDTYYNNRDRRSRSRSIPRLRQEDCRRRDSRSADRFYNSRKIDYPSPKRGRYYSPQRERYSRQYQRDYDDYSEHDEIRCADRDRVTTLSIRDGCPRTNRYGNDRRMEKPMDYNRDQREDRREPYDSTSDSQNRNSPRDDKGRL